MKKILLKIILLVAIAFVTTETYAVNIEKENLVVKQKNIKTVKFKVYGNCGMCKKTIESSLANVKGVDKAVWNKESKIMKVTFHEDIITLEDIKRKITGVGYDTEEYRADIETYEGLHGCCQYERPISKNNN